jgi:hypothetical protein
VVSGGEHLARITVFALHTVHSVTFHAETFTPDGHFTRILSHRIFYRRYLIFMFFIHYSLTAVTGSLPIRNRHEITHLGSAGRQPLHYLCDPGHRRKYRGFSQAWQYMQADGWKSADGYDDNRMHNELYQAVVLDNYPDESLSAS